MSFVSTSKNAFTVKAYVGDKKTLLVFNFSDPAKARNLAGFTIFCQPPGQVPGYYLNTGEKVLMMTMKKSDTRNRL